MISQIKTITPAFPKEAQNKQDHYTCVGCRIKFESIESQRAHFKTEWHLYNLKRRVCKLNPIDFNDFISIQATSPEQTQSNSVLIKEKNTPASHRNSGEDIQENEDDWEEIDEDSLLDEDYDDEEAAEMLSRVVKRDTCLFCAKKCPSMKANVEHMYVSHGFFLPEDQYLIDMEGLLDYLGFKVGAGATCLWCNKQFTSVHGVRLHMRYKDHCKILYGQNEAIEEFKEFYDYSAQEQIPMKPYDQLVLLKKRRETRPIGGTSLVKTNHNHSSKHLTSYKIQLPYQARSIKKFNAFRAKIVLRTSMANNETMRSRLRRQNPM